MYAMYANCPTPIVISSQLSLNKKQGNPTFDNVSPYSCYSQFLLIF